MQLSVECLPRTAGWGRGEQANSTEMSEEACRKGLLSVLMWLPALSATSYLTRLGRLAALVGIFFRKNSGVYNPLQAYKIRRAREQGSLPVGIWSPP